MNFTQLRVAFMFAAQRKDLWLLNRKNYRKTSPARSTSTRLAPTAICAVTPLRIFLGEMMRSVYRLFTVNLLPRKKSNAPKKRSKAVQLIQSAMMASPRGGTHVLPPLQGMRIFFLDPRASL